MPWMPPKKEAKKRMNPIWGGIGFILIPVYGLGSYWIAQMLVRENLAQSWIYIPGSITPSQQTWALAALLAFGMFAVTSIAWGMIRGPIGGPTDIHYSKYRHLKRRY